MAIPEILRNNSLLGGLLDFFIPPLCLGCSCYYDGDDGICADCRDSIIYTKRPVCLQCRESLPGGKINCPVCGPDSLILLALGEYDSPLSDLIIQMKFKGIKRLANEFAVQVVKRLGPEIQCFKADCLVPIPLQVSRERKRGYNQAELFAAKLSELLEIPVNDSILVRKGRRSPQAKLELSRREANIKNVFEAVIDDEDCEDGLKLILVDDVVTSGATVREAAKCLKSAGHEVVAIISISHKV